MENTKAKLEDVCMRIGISEDQLKKYIKELEQWLKDQKHLPQEAADRYLIEKFVLSGKGDLSKSMLKLDTYFTVRNFAPDLFTQRDPLSPELLTNSECMYMGLLPGITPDGARVLTVYLSTADASQFELRATMQRLFNILDVWLRTDPHVNKLYVVADSKKATLAIMMKLSITTMKNTIFCVQNVYPISLGGVFYLNMIPVVSAVMEKVIKPLFNKKLSKRFVFCGNDCSALYKKVPLSMMPRDYGGDGPTMKEINQTWINKVNENRDWLVSSASTPSDESLRDGESNDCMLEKFVIGGKGNLDKAKRRLDAYFAVRHVVPHYFATRSPQDSQIEATHDYLYVCMLPGLTGDGSRVFLVRLKHGDPSQYSLDGVAKRLLNILDVWLKTEPRVNRTYFVADCTHATKGHILKNPPKKIRDIVFCLQKVYPVGIPGIIFLNVTSVVKIVIEKGLRPFILKKLAKKICVYTGDYSEIYSYIPLSMMPREYGGDAPPLEDLNQEWIDRVNDHREWLVTAGTATTDESLRQGKSPISGGGTCTVM